MLDPGVVFGTGFHPTTRDCIFALETIGEMDAVETVFDIGTGTGLLALAAVKLGGRRALAVDSRCFSVLAAVSPAASGLSTGSCEYRWSAIASASSSDRRRVSVTCESNRPP